MDNCIRSAVNCCENEYDLIVAGGGPAGICASIASARMGMKTLLIEASSALGGMGTMGMVSTMAPFTDGEEVIYRSLPIEILSRYKRRMNIPKEKWDWIELSPEDLKRVYDDMVNESGVEVLFQTIACGACTGDGKINHIITANKEGVAKYKAKVYIDCTGDGDLAAFSNVPFEIGDDGTVQSSSLCFAISNIYTNKLNRKLQ